MPNVTTDDGVALSYTRVGEGPPYLLFMHGWAGSGRYFDATIEHLRLTGLGAVTYDLRGHGESAPANDSYPLARIAMDALAVADAAGLNDFVVVGFSMSAKFGQYLTLSAPERVAGLILVAGCSAGQMLLPDGMSADWLSRAGDANRMIELLEPFMTRPVRADLLERFGHDAARADLSALAGTLETVMTTSFTARLTSLATPTLVIGGRGDPMFPPDTLRTDVVAPLATARLALVDCGHEIPIEAPDEFAALIEAFLAGLG